MAEFPADQVICQACGMPLQGEAAFGRNADGSINNQYCQYCWVDGQYVGAPTVEEMIEVCVPHMQGMPPDEARGMLQQFLPQLAHWRSS